MHGMFLRQRSPVVHFSSPSCHCCIARCGNLLTMVSGHMGNVTALRRAFFGPLLVPQKWCVVCAWNTVRTLSTSWCRMCGEQYSMNSYPRNALLAPMEWMSALFLVGVPSRLVQGTCVAIQGRGTQRIARPSGFWLRSLQFIGENKHWEKICTSPKCKFFLSIPSSIMFKHGLWVLPHTWHTV